MTRLSGGGRRALLPLQEAALGSRDYARLRIGVGEPETAAALREHVLKEIAAEEAPVLEQAIRRAADAVECWVVEGALGAMNQFNRRPDPGQPGDPEPPGPPGHPSARMGPERGPGPGPGPVRQEESET